MLTGTVSNAPSRLASTDIRAPAVVAPPARSASAFAASFPLDMSRPWKRSSPEYVEPGDRPTFVPSIAASAGSATYVAARSILGRSASAVSTLRVLAGMNGTWALHDARTAPLVRSATSQPAAGRTGGAGVPGVVATWTPWADSRAPPTVDVGTGSGVGAEVTVPVTTWTALAHGGGWAADTGAPVDVGAGAVGVPVAATAGPASPADVDTGRATATAVTAATASACPTRRAA